MPPSADTTFNTVIGRFSQVIRIAFLWLSSLMAKTTTRQHADLIDTAGGELSYSQETSLSWNTGYHKRQTETLSAVEDY